MYRLFGIDYFDSVLLSGDYQKADIRTLEQQRGLPEKELVTVGCPYLDVFAARMAEIPHEKNHSFTVLVSPSWGPSALLTKYGRSLLDPLAAAAKTDGWRIIIRPNPQSKRSEPEILEKLEAAYKDNTNIEWDYNRDNIYSLSKADVMISDFSGIIYDYTFLRDKPVFYVNQDIDLRPYDAFDLGEDAKAKVWQFSTLKAIGIELKEEMFPTIKEIIKNASDNEMLKQARAKAKAEAWMYQGEAGKRIADFMINTVENQNQGVK
jgi:CDP-glycerol glycerophosphotransferase (TagB/SpsB family)